VFVLDLKKHLTGEKISIYKLMHLIDVITRQLLQFVFRYMIPID